jgi:hypothetical protein
MDRTELSSTDLRARIRQTLGELDELRESGSRPDQTLRPEQKVSSEQVLAGALQTVLLAADVLLGECRMERPFKPMMPVRDEKGNLLWCCTHPKPHC